MRTTTLLHSQTAQHQSQLLEKAEEDARNVHDRAVVRERIADQVLATGAGWVLKRRSKSSRRRLRVAVALIPSVPNNNHNNNHNPTTSTATSTATSTTTTATTVIELRKPRYHSDQGCHTPHH